MRILKFFFGMLTHATNPKLFIAIIKIPKMEEEMKESKDEVEAKKASKIIGIAVIFALLIGFALGYVISSSANQKAGFNEKQRKALSQEEVKVMVEDYIRNNLISPQNKFEIENNGETSGVYRFKITVESQGRRIKDNIYATKDGSFLFLSAFNTSLPAHAQVPEEEKIEESKGSAKISMLSVVDDDPVKGSENAKIIIVEFSDFQCPFCAKFFRETLPLIQKNYIETGKVKLVYRDFPLSSLHANAQKAAEAGECADEQGKFWEYHDTLFEKQSEWSQLSGEQVIAKFEEYAKTRGLNEEQFNACLESSKYAHEVLKDLEDGSKLGVQGTPTFLIGNSTEVKAMIPGALPYSEFAKVIENMLNESS